MIPADLKGKHCMDVAAFYLFSTLLTGACFRVIFARNAVHAVLYLIFAFFNAAGLFILLQAEFLAMILVVVYVGAVAVLFLFVVMMLEGVSSPQNRQLFWIKMREGARTFLLFISYTLCLVLLSWGSAELALYLMPQPLFDFYSNTFLETLYRFYPFSLTLGFFALYSLSTLWLVKKSFFALVKEMMHLLPEQGVLGLVLLAEFSYLLSHGFVLSPDYLWGTALPPDSLDNTHALGRLIYTNYAFLFQTAGFILLTAMIGAIVLTFRKTVGIKRQDVAAQLRRRKEDTLTLHDQPLRAGVEV